MRQRRQEPIYKTMRREWIGFVSQKWCFGDEPRRAARLNFPIDFEKILARKLMGGRGSGRTSGFGASKCSDYLAVDLDWLRRKGLLTPGRSSTIRWSRGSTPTGAINVRSEAAGLRLIYRSRSHGEEWHDINEFVPFIETATAFGGRRQWFCCLRCSRRCQILYGGARFRCRRCHRLRYDSQYEPAYARACSQSHKIRKSLGQSGSLDDPFPEKPKGMHWKTYNRLEELDQKLQNRWAVGVMQWIEQLK